MVDDLLAVAETVPSPASAVTENAPSEPVFTAIPSVAVITRTVTSATGASDSVVTRPFTMQPTVSDAPASVRVTTRARRNRIGARS